MTNVERSRSHELLPEAVSAATKLADISIAALKGRINDLRELHVARRDGLTGLWRAEYWEKLVQPQIEKIQAYGPESGDSAPNAGLLVFADAEDLHFINNELGYVIGNQAVFNSSEGMKAFADFIRGASRTHERRTDPARLAQGSRQHDLLGRLGGDEFVGFFQIHVGIDNSLEGIAQLITQRFKAGTYQERDEFPLISWGYTFILPGEDKALEEYIEEADPKAHMTDAEKADKEQRKESRRTSGLY